MLLVLPATIYPTAVLTSCLHRVVVAAASFFFFFSEVSSFSPCCPGIQTSSGLRKQTSVQQEDRAHHAHLRPASSSAGKRMGQCSLPQKQARCLHVFRYITDKGRKKGFILIYGSRGIQTIMVGNSIGARVGS